MNRTDGIHITAKDMPLERNSQKTKLQTYSVTLTDDTDSITVMQKSENKTGALCEVGKTFNVDEKDIAVNIRQVEK